MKKGSSMFQVASRGWPVLVALALAPGCGDDGPGGGKSVAGEIGPEGGTVRAGELELVVPAGALSKSTVITIAPTLESTAVEGREVALAFELAPDGLQFAVPAVARVKKTFAEAAPDPLLYLSSDGRRWERIADSTYEAGVTSGSVAHFSFLSVQVQQAPSGMGGAPPTTGIAGAAGEPTAGTGGQSPHGPVGEGGSPIGREGGTGPGGAGQAGAPDAGGAFSGAGGQGGETAVTCSAYGSAGIDCDDWDCSEETLCTGQLSCVGNSDVLESTWEWGAQCSDGHDYFVMCGDQNASTCECTCEIDNVVVGTCTYPKGACTQSQDALECDCPAPFPRFLDP